MLTTKHGAVEDGSLLFFACREVRKWFERSITGCICTQLGGVELFRSGTMVGYLAWTQNGWSKWSLVCGLLDWVWACHKACPSIELNWSPDSSICSRPMERMEMEFIHDSVQGFDFVVRDLGIWSWSTESNLQLRPKIQQVATTRKYSKNPICQPLVEFRADKSGTSQNQNIYFKSIL